MWKPYKATLPDENGEQIHDDFKIVCIKNKIPVGSAIGAFVMCVSKDEKLLVEILNKCNNAG